MMNKPIAKNDISVEDALLKGIITIGAWNDEDWDVDNIPQWRKALQAADKYYKMAGTTYTDKSREHRTGRKEPYIKFIQDVLRILICEAHLKNDDILTAATLYHITEFTNYSYSDIESEFGMQIVGMVQTLCQRPREVFGDYIGRCLKHECASVLIPVVLAVKIQEERTIDLCPLESWEENIPYYENLMQQIEPYIDNIFMERKWNEAVFLGQKLLKQIDDNMDLSRNRNKTAEDLYEGWNDENSQLLAHYKHV